MAFVCSFIFVLYKKVKEQCYGVTQQRVLIGPSL
jgi:hypothetical protein